jgi:phosphoribosyl 1,2-cyclic phosphodiesterase
LIDAGISAKQIVARLNTLKKNPASIKAIFITHEHCDHIRGVDVFARHFNIPIFATKKTAKNCFLCSDTDLINMIKNNEAVDLGGMKIQAFSKSHSGADPVAYNIFNGKKISVITDLGYASENITSNVSDSDFLCLEANHDEMMLNAGPYPHFLKRWIKSNTGHLSNVQSALCVLEHANSKLKNIVLSHLSQTNNTPKLALETFNFFLKERNDLHPKISVSERDKPTQIFKI